MSAEIRRLIDRWRERERHAAASAADYDKAGGDSAGNGHAFRKERRIWKTCADELDALLPALPPDDPPAVEDEKNEARVDHPAHSTGQDLPRTPQPDSSQSLKRKDTPASRAFWEHVEAVSRQVRADPRFHLCCAGRDHCIFSMTGEQCQDVLSSQAPGAVSRGDLSTEAPMQTDALEILRGIARRVKDRRCTLTLSLVDLDEIRACVSRASGAFSNEGSAVDPGATERPQEPIRATLSDSIQKTFPAGPAAPRLQDET